MIENNFCASIQICNIRVTCWFLSILKLLYFSATSSSWLLSIVWLCFHFLFLNLNVFPNYFKTIAVMMLIDFVYCDKSQSFCQQQYFSCLFSLHEIVQCKDAALNITCQLSQSKNTSCRFPALVYMSVSTLCVFTRLLRWNSPDGRAP